MPGNVHLHGAPLSLYVPATPMTALNSQTLYCLSPLCAVDGLPAMGGHVAADRHRHVAPLSLYVSAVPVSQ